MAGGKSVFISHAREERARWSSLLRALDAWGVRYYFDAHDTEAAEQPLTRETQRAIADCDVFLRLRTREIQHASWMRLEMGVFLDPLAGEQRAGTPRQRLLVNLIADSAYTPGPFDTPATVTIDTKGGTSPTWVNELRHALGLPPLVDPARAGIVLAAHQTQVSRRQMIGMGAAALALAGAGGLLIVRGLQMPPPSAPKATTPTPTATLPGDPRLLWRYQTGKSVSATPVVSNGLVYTGSQDATLYALDASTGKAVWTFQAKGGIQAGALVANGLLYTGCEEGTFYALNARTGEVLWTKPLGVRAFTPVVVRGRLYASISPVGGLLVALDPQTGEILQSNRHADTATSLSASSFDKFLYICGWQAASKTRLLYLIDTFDSQDIRKVFNLVAATYTPGQTDASFSTPTYANGTLYVGSVDHTLYAVAAYAFQERWHYKTGGIVSSTPAVANGLVYVGSEDASVYALDAATGAPRWRYRTGGPVRSSPVVVNGVVYIGSDDTAVHAIHATSGAPVRTYQTSGKVV
nr:toll/interleukin-1 receptor domain-containing protein [Ktedonobacterales bacterium]